MDKEKTKLKQLVIKTYSNIASQGSCCAIPASCCAPEINPMKGMLQAAGFTNITIKDKEKSNEIIKGWSFGEGVEKMVFSAYVWARKP